MSGKPDLRRIAYHEAGHAITSYAVGLEIIKISIIPSEGALGRVSHPPNPEWFRPDLNDEPEINERMEAHILSAHGGPVVEEIAFGEASWGERPGSDIDTITDFALRLSGSAEHASEICMNAWKRVETLLREHWEFVEIVTQELYQKRSLTPDEFNELVAKYPKTIELQLGEIV